MGEHPGSLSGNPPAAPLRLFLSHASSDKPRVRALHRRLEADGFAPWLDEVALAPGQDWDRAIRAAVRDADIVLVCLSRDAIQKAGYVQKEIRYVMDVAAEKPDGTVFVIPVELEPCELPERFQPYHAARLYEPDGYERLVAALRARAAERGAVVRPRPSRRRAVTMVGAVVTTIALLSALGTWAALSYRPTRRPTAGPARVPTGVLEIRTAPGANVVVDSTPSGRADGQGRLVLAGLAEGARRLRVTEPGHNPEERDVAVAADQTVVVTIPLRVVATADSSAAPPAAYRANRVLAGHGGGTWELRFSPDGRRLASAGHDDTLRVWDVASGAEIRSCALRLEGRMALVFGPADRARAAVVHGDSVRVFGCGVADSLERTLRPVKGGDPYALAFSPDATLLVTANESRRVIEGAIWNLDSGAKVWSVPSPGCDVLLPGHFSCDLEVAYRPDGRAMAVVGNGWVHVVDPGAGRTIRTLARPTGADSPDYTSPQFSADGRWIGVVERGRDRNWAPDRIQLWDAASGEAGLRLGPFPTIERHADGTEATVLTNFAFSPDGRGLAAASTTLAFSGARRALHAALRFYDLRTGAEARRQDFPVGIASLAFSPDGRWLALGMDDGSIRLWTR